MKYSFYARGYYDNSGNNTFSQEHYISLLELCFGVGAFFSFCINEETDITRKLHIWEISQPPCYWYQNETNPNQRRFFRADSSSYEYLKSISSDIFDFFYLPDHRYPEDLAFYRSDGSILLNSVAHEGECSVFPKTADEVRTIISYGGWMFMQNGDAFNEGTPAEPAINHQLGFQQSWQLLEDPLYTKLKKIEMDPSAHLNTVNISNLISFISGFVEGMQHTPIFCLPAHAPSYKPAWYLAFKMYVLAMCNANTNERLDEAILKIGYSNTEALGVFFDMLHRFTDAYIRTIEKDEVN